MAPASLLKMTPSKAHASSSGMLGHQGSPAHGSGISTIPQRNPWGQVSAVKATSLSNNAFQVSREGTQSPPSPEPSVSSTDTLTGHVYPSSTRKAGLGVANPQAASQLFSYGSPEAIRTASRRNQVPFPSPVTPNGNQDIQGSSFGSPDVFRHVARGEDAADKYGTPVKISQQIVRRGSIAGQGPPLSYGNPVPVQHRESIVSQGTPSSQPRDRSSKSTAPSQGAVTRASGLLHPTVNTDGQLMYAIPEGAAVQEFAFRRGQQDRGNTRDRIPPNPYHPSFARMWEAYYRKGKLSGNDAIVLPRDPPSPSRANYEWPPLVNPYTQTPEHPRGIYDERYARFVCVSALQGMEKLIKTICKRNKNWESTVCDVPFPIAVAILNYPDLMCRYEELRNSAREARCGSLPYRRF